MNKIVNSQKGYVILMITFSIMIIMLTMAMAVSFLTANRQKNITNTVKSTQAYYAAEAGIEDALLRLKEAPQTLSLSYNLNVNNAAVAVDILNAIGASKTITAQANNKDVNRKVQVVCSIGNSLNASFYYGVEVGAGGLVMNNGSKVMGNVFSAGDISGSGIIDGDVVVSGNGHSIKGVTVNKNAMAYSCLSPAIIKGSLVYVTGGLHTCAVSGTTSTQSEEISEQPLPIPQSQINDWKAGAAAVQVFTGNKTISGNQTLGPIKITGNLTIRNNAKLNMTGTVYVAGNISISNNSTVKLDSSYGSLGGVLVADGTIHLSNNNTFSGSGQPGSYLLVLSINTSDDAISISNNVSGGVFYTSAGGLDVSNNVSLIEATGYKVIMQNNSTIEYSSGVVNIYFTSGPGAGWEVASWQEY